MGIYSVVCQASQFTASTLDDLMSVAVAGKYLEPTLEISIVCQKYKNIWHIYEYTMELPKSTIWTIVIDKSKY